MDFPAAWCDAFVDWCFYKAYGTATAKSLLGGNFDDYTVASALMYQKKGALDTTPSVGAQVFWTRNGLVSGCYHTGLVRLVENGYVYTLEGNTSPQNGVRDNGGGVYAKQYLIKNYAGRWLFGHPAYDKVQADTTPKAQVPDKTPRWVGQVCLNNPASTLSVRSWAGTEYPRIKAYPALGHGNMIDVCDTIAAKDGSHWYYVRIANKFYGFVHSSYVKKVS